MSVKLSEEAKQRIAVIRKGFKREDFKREGRGIPIFADADMIRHEMATGIVKRIPGKPGKNRGTVYKHKRRIIQKSRRANR